MMQQRQCCLSCKCSSDCGILHDCCPDIIPDEKLIFNNIMTSPKMVCLPTSVKFDLYEGVVGINSCLLGSESKFRNKCHESGNQNKDIGSLDLPVTDLNTSLTYKNKYCALCNNVPEERISSWIPKLKCNSLEDFLNISQEIDLISDIFNVPTCNILYTSNLHINEVDTCMTVATTCNVTGLWQTWDWFLEWACTMYISPVVTADKVVYGNIFCALCNGEEPICPHPPVFDSGGIDLPEPFSAIISTKPLLPVLTQCPQGFLWSSMTKSCLRAHCSLSRRLKNNVCQPVLTQLTRVKYQLSLRIFPLSTFSIWNGYRTETILLDWLYRHIHVPQGLDANLEGYMLFMTSCLLPEDEHLTDNTTVSYLDVTMVYYLVQKHNPEEIRRTFIESINNEMISINVDGNDTWSFISLVRDDPGDATETAKCRTAANNTMYVDVGCIGSGCMVLYELSKASAWYDVVSQRFTVPLLTARYVFGAKEIKTHAGLSIFKFNKCPRITIVLKDRLWQEQPSGLWIQDSDVFLNLSEFSFETRNMDSIGVCLDTYLKMYPASRANRLQGYLESRLPFVAFYFIIGTSGWLK